MSDRKTWEQIKSARADTHVRRAGYAEAKEASELEARLRAEREGLGLTQAELG